jgi:hypothetical protein
MDAAREDRWDETGMLEYRQQDLTSTHHINSGHSLVSQIDPGHPIEFSCDHTRGLLPIFVSSTSTECFDKTLYPRHRAQGLKEDLW